MSSIRLWGLSSGDQFAQIVNHIRLLKDPTFIQSSGVARVEHGFEATITLRNTSNKTKALAILNRLLPEKFPTIQLEVDDAFLGVTTLVCPATLADDEITFEFVAHARDPPWLQADELLSVVAVHGLGGHGANTWTCSNPVAHMWIRDFLPQSFSNARVMTFGYESRVLSRSTGGIQEAAMQLLNGLMHRTGKEKVCSARGRISTTGYSVARSRSHQFLHRPLIFMAHSLGGLIVKAASVPVPGSCS